MASAGKRRFSLDSLWLYALAAGAVGFTGWLLWRSPALSGVLRSATAATNSPAPTTAPDLANAARAQSDLERLMSMSTTPQPVTARPASGTVNLTASEAGVNDAKRGELVIVGKSGVTRVMTKAPAGNSAPAAGTAAGAPLAARSTPPPGPRVFEPDPLKPPTSSNKADEQPKQYNYDDAERNRANNGGLPTYGDSRDVQRRP